jgi:hypothetical protein
MKITTIGLDLAKSIFQVHGVDATGQVVVRKSLRRSQMLPRCAFRCAFPGSGKRKRAMTKDDLKKGQRINPRNPKTGIELPTSRVVVFKASAILNQRINRHSLVTMRDRFASGH